MTRGDGVDAWSEPADSESADIELTDVEPVEIDPAAAAESSPTPTTEQIAEVAYRLHEDGVEGDHLSHWLTAERLLAGN
jgi:hypothetical protein